jgi:S1-C subfamily serine protease
MTGLLLGAGLTAAAMLLSGVDNPTGTGGALASREGPGTEVAPGTAGGDGLTASPTSVGSTESSGGSTGSGGPVTGSGVASGVSSSASGAHRDTAAVPGDLTSGARQSQASVVQIQADRGGAALAGYGVELPTPGVVLTTDTLIEGVDDVSVIDRGGNRSMATVVGTDPVTDVGVLRVQTTNWSPISVSATQPWDTEVVSALTQSAEIYLGQIRSTWASADVPGRQPMLGSLAADIPLPADAIGAPLFTSDGRLMGMVGAIQIGGFPVLAVAGSTAESAVENLLATGTVPHGWIGVEQAAAVKGGVRLEQIQPNSPAVAAGLRPGDVIAAVDGQNLRTVDDLRAAIQLRQPGSRVEMSIINTSHHTGSMAVTLGDLAGH